MNLEKKVESLLSLVEAQFAEILLLRERLEILERENKELKRRLNQDSNNSSKPPSSDSIFNKADRPKKSKIGNSKRGGQPGHKGNKLNKFAKVDHHIEHKLDHCPICESQELHFLDTRSKQVLDIPIPKIEVTEHIFYNYKCRCCGENISSPLAQELNQEVQYGVNIKSVVNYLNVYQLIPYKRLTELLEVIYGHKISQGSISNFNKELNDKLGGFVEQVKLSLCHSTKVLHSDETGCMVSKALHWVHVYSDKTKTLLQGHTNRGRKAMNELGILNQSKGIFIHDRWKSYMGYDHLEHALCNAHILRELKSIEENEKKQWSTQIKKLLIKANEYKTQNNLPLKRAQRLQIEYESILRNHRPYYQEQERLLQTKNKKGRKKRTLDHNLFMALWKYKKEILLFMHKPDVPFDNNLAERDLRMLKVKMKISNQFLSLKWLNIHATIRSYISSVQKKNLNIIESIRNAHINPALAIKVAV